MITEGRLNSKDWLSHQKTDRCLLGQGAHYYPLLPRAFGVGAESSVLRKRLDGPMLLNSIHENPQGPNGEDAWATAKRDSQKLEMLLDISFMFHI